MTEQNKLKELFAQNFFLKICSGGDIFGTNA